jgi:uncharacterized membrane protein YeaQ/YmgE (transglycosylase-associated protein family)
MTTNQRLRDVLVGLGVKSLEIIDKADDWLIPILVESSKYQKLNDRKNVALQKKGQAKSNVIAFIVFFVLIVTVYWFINFRHDGASLKEIVWGIIGSVILIMLVKTWIDVSNQYHAALRKTELFAEQWEECVRVIPASVERLMDLNRMIQACESVLRQKNVSTPEAAREQTLEYILIVRDNPVESLREYFSAVENSSLDGAAKSHLIKNPMVYAFIYFYSPSALLAFIDACYAKYQEDPYSLYTSWIEITFDQYVLKALGG